MEEASDAAARKNTLARLWTHVLQKGWQAGSVIGVGIVTPWVLKGAVTGTTGPPSKYLKVLGYSGPAGFVAIGEY